MIIVMKMISLAFDLDSGAARDLPPIWDYCGYVLHCGSVMFGPWTSFQDYSLLLSQPEERIFVSDPYQVPPPPAVNSPPPTFFGVFVKSWGGGYFQSSGACSTKLS